MRIYELRTLIDEREEPFWAPLGLATQALRDELGYRVHWSIRDGGTSFRDGWQPLPLEVNWYGDAQNKPLPDIFSIVSHSDLGLSSRAVACLGNLLEGQGELLPLTFVDGNYFYFHVTNVIDALDLSKSYVRWSSRTYAKQVGSETKYEREKYISQIYIYSFVEERLEGVHLFRLPMTADSSLHVFCTHDFKERVESCHLRSLDFLLVWDSEDPEYTDERYRYKGQPERWEQHKREFASIEQG